MTNEIDIFKNLTWKYKVEHMNTFYQAMIKKTDNPEYINKFQSKIDEVNAYEENESNTDKLISLYERIIGSKEKTKQRKMKEIKQAIEQKQQRLARIESDECEEDPDQYLAEAMAKIQ